MSIPEVKYKYVHPRFVLAVAEVLLFCIWLYYRFPVVWYLVIAVAMLAVKLLAVYIRKRLVKRA